MQVRAVLGKEKLDVAPFVTWLARTRRAQEHRRNGLVRVVIQSEGSRKIQEPCEAFNSCCLMSYM